MQHLWGFPGNSADKESACNAEDPGSIPGLRRSARDGIAQLFLSFPGGSAGEECACNAGDPGFIPGLGRSPREENGYPLQYSGLEKPWGRKESDTTERLSLSFFTITEWNFRGRERKMLRIHCAILNHYFINFTKRTLL